MNRTSALLTVACFALAVGIAIPATVAPADDGFRGAPALAEAQKAPVVNARCPIMGGGIDPTNVPDSLTRMYKGQKVGFCCAGCPPAWDKLADEEKDKKLAAAIDKD